MTAMTAVTYSIILTLILVIVTQSMQPGRNPDLIEGFDFPKGWCPQFIIDGLAGIFSLTASLLGQGDWYAEREEAIKKDTVEPAAGLSSCCSLCISCLCCFCPSIFMVL
jgi:hypothetical protein